MAVLKILRLNKMTCGNRRGLIDMDIQIQGIHPEVYLLPATEISGLPFDKHDAGIATESNTDYKYVGDNAIYDYYRSNKNAIKQENTVSDLVLNENQISIDIDTYNNKLSATGTLNGSDAIQLTPEYWVDMSERYSKADEFNTQVSSINVVYEFEMDLLRNQKAALSAQGSTTSIIPLNDLLDLCVKSMFKKSKLNYAIPGNLLLDNNQMTHSMNVDQYFVFEQNPVSFCQFKGDAFLISQSTTKQPYRIQSNIKDQIQTGQMNEAHSFSLVQDPLSTVLYPDLGTYGTKSYSEYIGQNRLRLEQQQVIDMFTPSRYITDINYNYVVMIEQNRNPNRQFDNPTIYDNGDIYGFFTTGKNMYNALYSIEMSSSQRIENCREYAGVQDVGDKLMLKFYDSIYYYIDSQQNAHMLSSSSSITHEYPYQKVETYQPVKFGHNTRHKSNLFSIKIYNSGLDEQSMDKLTSQQRQIGESLKKSISNAMKNLADSIAPANTQLFATYFHTNE